MGVLDTPDTDMDTHTVMDMPGESITNKTSQRLIGDEALALLVIKFESIFELSLHLFKRRILNYESCTKLTEFSKLNFTRSILIDFMEEICKLLLCWPKSHGSHDLSQIITRQEVLFLCIKEIKAHLQALYFIRLKICQVIDLFEIDISVRVCSSHDVLSLGLCCLSLLVLLETPHVLCVDTTPC